METKSKISQKKKMPSWAELKEMILANFEQMQETDRQMQETFRRMRETDRQMKETDRRMQETDRQMKETDRRMQETDRQMKETDRRMQETDRQISRTEKLAQKNERDFVKMRKEMREMNNRFFSQAGHIIEGLMEPSAIKMFQKRGYDIDRCWKNFKKHSKEKGWMIEADLLLLDDKIAIVVEVKINCTHRDIDHFIQQMGKFKGLCPEYADKEILPAIAAVNYDRGSDKYAHEQGLLVVRVSNDNVFALDSSEGDTLLTF